MGDADPDPGLRTAAHAALRWAPTCSSSMAGIPTSVFPHPPRPSEFRMPPLP